MKKVLLFAAVALVALASCSSEEMIGVTTPQDNSPSDVSNAITFSSSSKGITRADLYGSAAAAKLGNKFVVYGTKHTSAESATAANDAVVYKNFQVAWTTGTAGTTASNSSDWEYVGLTAYDATITAPQGIKYWDYSAVEGYTFYAFSSTDISYPKNSSDLVEVTKVTSDESGSPSLYNKGYQVTVKNGATLNNLYFSDRVPVAKTNYDKTVDFTFRNIGAKVRVGFYETIPGYTVKIDQFYIDDANSAVVTDFATMNDAQTDGFYASLQNVKTSANQTINVTYYDAGTVINRPKVSNPTGGYDYNIKIGDGSGIINTVLGTASNSPTWADGSASGNYTPVFPFEANTNPLLLKLDFTMTAEDGSGDVIKVRGARAIVPAQYVQWKSNFAYTYLFKISDKSNGTTGKVDANGDPITDPTNPESDPEGLKPITFDAIVVDVANEKQETITSVSTNSITTYAKGAIVDEYTHGESIYVAITDNNSTPPNVITPSAIGTAAGNAQVYKLGDATTEAAMLAHLNGLDMGITKSVETATIENTIPLADGTTRDIKNVKFTPSTAGYYAYVYTTTAYATPTYTVQTSGSYNSGETYYMKTDNNVYYAVAVPSSAAFDEHKSHLYLASNGSAGVYDVKIIKVQ